MNEFAVEVIKTLFLKKVSWNTTYIKLMIKWLPLKRPTGSTGSGSTEKINDIDYFVFIINSSSSHRLHHLSTAVYCIFWYLIRFRFTGVTILLQHNITYFVSSYSSSVSSVSSFSSKAYPLLETLLCALQGHRSCSDWACHFGNGVVEVQLNSGNFQLI